ncbi:MAG TPA: hypothetical protein VFW09_11910 [Solirubrobacteraceae bacterium]|nr:hypothetical protein [Solirubrobacteraceae bacterium]
MSSSVRSLTLTLAFVASALLIVVLPRAAAALQLTTSTTPATTLSASPASSAATAAGSVCTLPGLVRSDGSRCPGTGRLRRQILGIPNPLHYINPVNVIQKITGGAATTVFKTVALGVLVGWVSSGAESALKGTAKVIDSSTKPQLTSGWFSASYWRIAAIAALLTLPFLCAAAIHALLRSDLGLLTRAAFGYLPLSLLAVAIASQLTMLLLSAIDEMTSIVSSAAGNEDGLFLAKTGVAAIVSSIATTDPFVVFLTAIVTVGAALTLWLELLVRDAAVYVIVLMLPLFFAAMVWPARRMLVIRAIEVLIALILSKFAIVAVLALGGAALDHSSIPDPAAMLTGATLVLLAAFSPWALLRMLPLHEVASAAAGGLSQGLKHDGPATGRAVTDVGQQAVGLAADGAAWLRPRLASGKQSLLDGSRYLDAHRSAMMSESGPAEDPARPGEGGGEPTPAASGIVGGGPGGGDSASSDATASGGWSWPRRSSSAQDADASGERGIGTGSGAGSDGGTGPAVDTGATHGPGRHGPGGDRDRSSPVFDDTLELGDHYEVPADQAPATGDHLPPVLADALDLPRGSAELDPPPLADDEVERPTPLPGRDPIGPHTLPPQRDPTAAPQTPSPGHRPGGDAE